ncbi:hypothetical protein BIV57_00410 [Mangrovactinospora gilvigrisea]|uniref:Uncharacterized protein n=1 Tax=Mangrovactinospora gilvigrisea TaxID=1428644 RepID=A0A1J7CCS2_9ACTN|nr:hypothetical protein [Mangrovactinospora gilvigrisea]OIV39344.1 hypothetical protein BIV57_00410 [Mangrovactinospora gilvigrisea]
MEEPEEDAVAVYYRAEVADAHSSYRLVPPHKHLESAQGRCETNLGLSYPGAEADLEIRWVANEAVPPRSWRMEVRTPLLEGRFVAVGYWVTVVGSALEGVPKALPRGPAGP